MDIDSMFQRKILNKIVSVDANLLQSWIFRDIVKATEPGKGQGNKSLFSVKDAFWVEVLYFLRQAQIPMKLAQAITDSAVDAYINAVAEWNYNLDDIPEELYAVIDMQDPNYKTEIVEFRKAVLPDIFLGVNLGMIYFRVEDRLANL